MKELDPNKDLEINIHDLSNEFKVLPHVFFRYIEAKNDAERFLDGKKASLKELKGLIWGGIIRDSDKKPSDKTMEADIDCNHDVIALNVEIASAKRDYTTLAGAVESMKTKKDMLIQLGADARKEQI